MSQCLDNEKEVVTCGPDGKIMYWDAYYPEPVKVISDPMKAQLLCCAVSPSGKFLAVGGHDEIVRIWDIKTDTLITKGWCHSSQVSSLAWSLDEKQLVTTSLDCSIAIWTFNPQ